MGIWHEAVRTLRNMASGSVWMFLFPHVTGQGREEYNERGLPSIESLSQLFPGLWLSWRLDEDTFPLCPFPAAAITAQLH